MHILRQKTNFTLHVFLKSCKPIGNCYSGYLFGHTLDTPKKVLSICGKLLCYLETENQLHPPSFCGDIGKVLILDTLGMPGYAHPER